MTTPGSIALLSGALNPFRSFKGSGKAATNTVTINSIPTTNGELLVVCAGAGSATGTANLTISNTGTALSWTEITATHNGHNDPVASIFYATAVGETINITVSYTTTGGEQVVLAAIYGYSGHSGVGVSGSTSGDDIAETITLSGTPAATSEIIGVFVATEFRELTMAPGANGGTELLEDSQASASWVTNNLFGAGVSVQFQVQARSPGSTSTSFDWTMTTNNEEYGQAEIAIEIKVSATNTPTPATVTGTGSVQAPSIKVTGTATPATVSRTGAVQAPTILAVDGSPYIVQGPDRYYAPAVLVPATGARHLSAL